MVEGVPEIPHRINEGNLKAININLRWEKW